ncbi:MAG: hypothetical protein KGJ78_00400 [Alphaproteobacteria bacterium]|nr:hypothetical protein [Alphaproteobacteria bacterium]
MLSIGRALGALFIAASIAVGAHAEALNAPQWKFSATFPCQSELSGDSTDTDIGKIAITTYGCATKDVDNYFAVAISDYPLGSIKPDNIDSVYAGGVSGGATAMGGTIRNVMPITLGKITGREAIIDIPDKKLVARTRLFIIGDRMYQVIVVGAPGIETSKDCLDFLDSFKLLDG